MINLKEELKNFPKIDLDSIKDKNISISEDIRNAVSLYNSAISKIETSNTDIAIIELKKAISIFPEFYDAILLLGVCVFYDGDRIEAINIFNSIRDDEERKRAIAYLEDLAERDARKARLKLSNPERKTPAGQGREDAGTDNKQTVRPNSSKGSKPHTKKKKEAIPKIEPKGVFAYEKKSVLDSPVIIKGLAYVAVLLVLVCLFSWAVQAIRRIQMTDSPEYVELENKYKEELERANKYYNLYEGLKSRNSELYSKYILPIINQKYNEGKINDLVELLYLLDIDAFTDPGEKDRVSNIKREVLNTYSDTAYANGQSYYNQNNFNKAIEEFEKILKYNPDYQQIHWVLLNLGKSYRNIGENNKAIEAYDRLINEHGDTDAARQAVPLLNQLIEAIGLDRTPVVLPTPGTSATPGSGTMSPSQEVTGSPDGSETASPGMTTAPGNTVTKTPGRTPTKTPAATPSPTPKPTDTPSPSRTPSPSPSPVPTQSPSVSPTETATNPATTIY